MRLDELKKSLEEFRDLLKSNYGPKGYGQYTPEDNIRRKAKNVEENVIEGPNRNAKKYTTATKGTYKQQAAAEARQMHAKSKKNPVKTYSPDELKEFAAQRGMNVSTKKNDELTPTGEPNGEFVNFNANGQWKFMKNVPGYGSGVSAVGAGVSGAPFPHSGMSSAKKAEDKMSGGKADKKRPSDFDPEQLAIGVQHEMEHTSDEDIAREIAMDHLAEDPEYYSKLETMENQDDKTP